MKTETLLLIGLVGVAAWLLLSQTGRAAIGAPVKESAESQEARLKALIGAIQPKAPKKDKLTLTQGAIMGATYGSVVPGWGTAIGAGAGAIASIFVD